MPDQKDKAIEALKGLGEGCDTMGRALETVALLGMLYIGYKCCSDLGLLKNIFGVKTEVKKEALTCGDCNKKAVCPTCTQKVCVICKQKPCSS